MWRISFLSFSLLCNARRTARSALGDHQFREPAVQLAVNVVQSYAVASADPG
jgi:hypothetical protein